MESFWEEPVPDKQSKSASSIEFTEKGKQRLIAYQNAIFSFNGGFLLNMPLIKRARIITEKDNLGFSVTIYGLELGALPHAHVLKEKELAQFLIPEQGSAKIVPVRGILPKDVIEKLENWISDFQNWKFLAETWNSLNPATWNLKVGLKNEQKE
jgi:hypothetical protein